MEKLPEKVDDLINELDKAFPLRNFPSDTPYHVMQREFGARDVIDHLRSLQQDRAERVAEEFGGKGDGDNIGQWSKR